MARIINIIKSFLTKLITELIEKINIILFIIFSGVVLLCVYSNLNKTQITLTIIFSALILIGVYYLIKQLKEERNYIPKLNKRFTHKNEFNAWYVKRSEWQEAIMYLAELEDYIHGK